MEFLIDAHGGIRCIYGEALNLHALGELTIVRASSVEPDDQGWWWADLGPVDGPRLGPCDHRSQALDAERAWLEQHWLHSKLFNLDSPLSARRPSIQPLPES